VGGKNTYHHPHGPGVPGGKDAARGGADVGKKGFPLDKREEGALPKNWSVGPTQPETLSCRLFRPNAGR